MRSSRRGPDPMEFAALQEETPERWPSLSTCVSEDRPCEDTAGCGCLQVRRGVLPDTELSETLISDF